jgi:hypothetical protein
MDMVKTMERTINHGKDNSINDNGKNCFGIIFKIFKEFL